jgi:dopamine beta-monooxygenase
MVFYLTSKLRPYNAGILNIGQTEIAIPPGKEEHTERGTCDTTCTKQIMTDKITVVSVYNHMHYLGELPLIMLLLLFFLLLLFKC